MFMIDIPFLNTLESRLLYTKAKIGIKETASLLFRAPAPPGWEKMILSLINQDNRFIIDEDGVSLAPLPNNISETILKKASYVVVDFETTGGYPPLNRAIEIGIVRIDDGKITSTFESLFNTKSEIPDYISKMTGISPEMLKCAPKFESCAEKIKKMADDAIFIAHNMPFDWSFWRNEFNVAWGKVPLLPRACTLKMARFLLPREDPKNLDALAYRFGFTNKARHRALGDAMVTAHLLIKLIDLFEDRGILSVSRFYSVLYNSRKYKN